MKFLEKIDLPRRGWMVVDHWESDLCALGIAALHDPRRLVYVSTFNMPPGLFSYECEVGVGPNMEEYTTTGYDNNVTYEELVGAIKQHLSTPT